MNYWDQIREYLRTKIGGKGDPDYVKHIAHMVEVMPKLTVTDPGWREAYLKNLAATFGDGLEQKFVAYLESSKGKPSARFAGTVFEPWLHDETVAKDLRAKGLEP